MHPGGGGDGGGGDGGGGDGGGGEAGGGGGGVLRCTHCRGIGPASASALELSSCKRGAAVDNIQALPLPLTLT